MECTVNKGMSHTEILYDISHLENPEQYTYVIMGKPGPTGKSWLCKQLKDRGFKAVESDYLNLLYRTDINKNYYFVYPDVKTIVIVLNRTIMPKAYLKDGK